MKERAIEVPGRPSITAATTAVEIGTGGLGIYVNSGGRDYAVTLAPLGGVRVHAWNGGAWTE